MIISDGVQNGKIFKWFCSTSRSGKTKFKDVIKRPDYILVKK